jgi:hypothetical protein
MYVMGIINPLSLRIKEISMNERIRELAKQAGMLDFSQVSGGRYKVTEIDIEEFAELIVRECAKVADGDWADPWADPGHQIKEHFGVKE